MGCECDRFMEVWNNVFTQFEGDGKGNYEELAQKNIDTGMGLERLATVVQDVDSIFDVDTIRSLRDKVCEIAKKSDTKIILNPAPFKELPNEIFSQIDYIIPNIFWSKTNRFHTRSFKLFPKFTSQSYQLFTALF